MNMNMLMQQAQKMQKDIKKAQEEVEKQIFTSKQPLVEVEVSGKKEITKITIDKNITLDDIEMLEDMILLATNDAIKKANNELESRLGKFGQGLSGLF